MWFRESNGRTERGCDSKDFEHQRRGEVDFIMHRNTSFLSTMRNRNRPNEDRNEFKI
jgi:hypothetical protein